MSFEKDYPNRKDWRKPYRRAAKYFKSCRPHGSCSFCVDNRLYQDRKQRLITNEKLKEWEREGRWFGDDY